MNIDAANGNNLFVKIIIKNILVITKVGTEVNFHSSKEETSVVTVWREA